MDGIRSVEKALKQLEEEPYLLETAPQANEQIGWAESNAVGFANTVLGARTQKYPELLDVFIALTGRAPYGGCHTPEGRMPKLCIDMPRFVQPDDSVIPLLGYYTGKIAGAKIPLVRGMEALQPTESDMKAFGAAFATTSSAAMVHIKGLRPEATGFIAAEDSLSVHDTTYEMLASCHKGLNSATDLSVDLVCLGNPHFSLEEFDLLDILCKGRRKNSSTQLIITTNRTVYQSALDQGFLQELEVFGAKLITDTCWCMLGEPVVPKHARNLMANSAKFAHYGPGLAERRFHFGTLLHCIDAVCSGENVNKIPHWLLN